MGWRVASVRFRRHHAPSVLTIPNIKMDDLIRSTEFDMTELRTEYITPKWATSDDFTYLKAR